MKNINSKLTKTILGIGLISNSLLGYTGEIEKREQISFTEKDFKLEKYEFNKINLEMFTDVLYDLDEGKKLIMNRKMLEEEIGKKGINYLDDFIKQGYDLLLDLKMPFICSLEKRGNMTYFVLDERYLNINQKGELIVAPILEKIKRISRQEIEKNKEIKENSLEYKNRVYVIKTDKNNLFILRYLDKSIKDQKIELEIYKIKEDHQ